MLQEASRKIWGRQEKGDPMEPRPGRALLIAWGLLLIGVVGVLPYYAFVRQEGGGLRAFAAVLAALAVATLVGFLRARPWATWTALTVVSAKLVVDLFNYALELDRASLPISTALNLFLLVLLFRRHQPAGPWLTSGHKIFYGFVLALAGMVGIWGCFLPADILRVLPFSVPPLHARFLGSMYLSGATFMLLGLLAREWAEMRIVTPMISLWTGTLGVVSLFHLAAFDWSRVQVWIWFLAYAAYPVIAAWIAWQQRFDREPAAGPDLAAPLRSYLGLQGLAVTLLAGLLLVAPSWMATLWPWKITPVLAHIYGAPFLSYGLGSLMAARARRWREVRIAVLATLVFAAGVLIASLVHRALFDFARPAVWIWFGGFGVATVALALFAAVPRLSRR
jgi:hypothetical protein